MQAQSLPPPNANVMGVQQIKDVLHYRIEQADDDFLQMMYAMVEVYAQQRGLDERDDVVGYQAGEPLTMEELKVKIGRAEEQIDRGEYLTTEQLRQESEEWLSESTE